MTEILFITPNFENNGLGRTYCLWLLAKELGMRPRVVGIRGNHLWEPIQRSAFADDCVLPADLGPDPTTTLAGMLRHADVAVAVKPLPSSYGLARSLASGVTPLIVDVDDPDLEVRTKWLPVHERAVRRILDPRYREVVRLARLLPRERVIVSNPELQRLHGGTLIPHVRTLPDDIHYSRSERPVVRFVGTVRGHKGLETLRNAVGELAADGYSLEVTADPPHDRRPWERWLGNTTVEEGLQLVANADIIAVPSLPLGYAPAQLPVKLVDAMVFGRPVVASDLAPIRWAWGNEPGLVPPGDVGSFVAALKRLADPDERERIGRSARERGEARFSVQAVAPTFARVVAEAVGCSKPNENQDEGGGVDH